MSVELILMGERNELLRVSAQPDNLRNAFGKLLDHMEDTVKELPSPEFDVHRDLLSIIYRDISYARKHSISREDILSFYTPDMENSLFSVVLREF